MSLISYMKPEIILSRILFAVIEILYFREYYRIHGNRRRQRAVIVLVEVIVLEAEIIIHVKAVVEPAVARVASVGVIILRFKIAHVRICIVSEIAERRISR